VVTVCWSLEAKTTAKTMIWISDIRLAFERIMDRFEAAHDMPAPSDEVAADGVVGRAYTLGELSALIQPERRRYPPALFPATKREFSSSIGRYAKRLKYERLLTYEALASIAMRFYDAMPKEERPKGERLKVCLGAARSSFDWVQTVEVTPKLEGEALKESRAKAGEKGRRERTRKAAHRLEEVARLRDRGMTQREIAGCLGVSTRTIKSDFSRLKKQGKEAKGEVGICH